MGNRLLSDRILSKEKEVQNLKDDLERLKVKARKENLVRRKRASFHLGEVVAAMSQSAANDTAVTAVKKAVAESHLSDADKADVLAKLSPKQKLEGHQA